jgi:tetratricopeptide (TPR) repeat protein
MLSINLVTPVKSSVPTSILPGSKALAAQWHPALARVLALGVVVWVSVSGDITGSELPSYQPEIARNYLGTIIPRVEPELGTGAEALFALARVRRQLGELDEARRLARLALAQDAGRAEIHSFLAGLYLHEDRMEEGAEALKEALELRPDHAPDTRRLGMVLDHLGDRQGALACLERALAAAPQDAITRLVLGRLLLDLGEAGKAAEQLRTACELDPEQGGAFYALAEAQTRLGDTAGARESLARFQVLKRQEREAYDLKHKTYDDAVFMRTLVSGFHTEVAGLLIRQRRPGAAEPHLRQAISIAPESIASHEMLAALLLQEGRRKEAREVCATLVRIAPEQPVYRANLGMILLQLNEVEAGAEELRRALELDPGQPEALNNLARFYLGTRRQLAEALAMSRRLAEIRPSAASFDLLGWALYANGRTEEARAAAAQAVEREPGNPVYRERLRRLEGRP